MCGRVAEVLEAAAGAGSALSGLSFSLDAAADVLWSPVVKGDTIGVEISLPSAQATCPRRTARRPTCRPAFGPFRRLLGEIY